MKHETNKNYLLPGKHAACFVLARAHIVQLVNNGVEPTLSVITSENLFWPAVVGARQRLNELGLDKVWQVDSPEFPSG